MDHQQILVVEIDGSTDTHLGAVCGRLMLACGEALPGGPFGHHTTPVSTLGEAQRAVSCPDCRDRIGRAFSENRTV